MADHPMIDEGSFVPHSDGLTSRDPLGWPDYESSLSKARERAGADESVVAGRAKVGGHEVELASFNFGFHGGSMGEVAGERIARAMERAAGSGHPFVLLTATGGARMQEGMVSLVQMPKIVTARRALGRAGVPYIAVFGDPTTGGVLASVGALADYTIAEEGSTVGFAGPRLVERFTGTRIAQDSHTAESALAAGLIDTIEPRDAIKARVAQVLSILGPDEPRDIDPPETSTHAVGDVVAAARRADRPTTRSLVDSAVDAFVPLHGDRAGTLAAGYMGFARVAGRRCMVIATDSRFAPPPADYRKARRCLEIADRLRLPVVTVVDTPGADPSESSEAGGIAWEIARLFDAMLSVDVPVLSIVTGEGGSGGALAFATADVLSIYDDAFFSVIAPESAAEILWRAPNQGVEAAALLKLDAVTLQRLGIADEVLAGPPTPGSLRSAVAYHLARLVDEDPTDRALRRERRWRRYGQGSETSS